MNDYKELIEKLRNQECLECVMWTEEQGCTSISTCIMFLQAADAIEQLVKERDAAVDDLRISCDCESCKWLIGEDCADLEHKECHGEHWEWRGVQEADNE